VGACFPASLAVDGEELPFTRSWARRFILSAMPFSVDDTRPRTVVGQLTDAPGGEGEGVGVVCTGLDAAGSGLPAAVGVDEVGAERAAAAGGRPRRARACSRSFSSSTGLRGAGENPRSAALRRTSNEGDGCSLRASCGAAGLAVKVAGRESVGASVSCGAALAGEAGEFLTGVAECTRRRALGSALAGAVDVAGAGLADSEDGEAAALRRAAADSFSRRASSRRCASMVGMPGGGAADTWGLDMSDRKATSCRRLERSRGFPEPRLFSSGERPTLLLSIMGIEQVSPCPALRPAALIPFWEGVDCAVRQSREPGCEHPLSGEEARTGSRRSPNSGVASVTRSQAWESARGQWSPVGGA